MIGTGKGGGSSGGGGMDALMGSPLMQTLTGRNTPPEMAGNSASLDPLAMLRGNADYWQNQRANVQQGGQNFAGGLQDLAQLFLGNQASQGGGGAMPLPEIMRPQRPPMVMTGRAPGLQQTPAQAPAQARQPALQGFLDQVEAIRNQNRFAQRGMRGNDDRASYSSPNGNFRGF